MKSTKGTRGEEYINHTPPRVSKKGIDESNQSDPTATHGYQNLFVNRFAFIFYLWGWLLGIESS
jgi:hypothetical protein